MNEAIFMGGDFFGLGKAKKLPQKKDSEHRKRALCIECKGLYFVLLLEPLGSHLLE
ncbi:MAG: hypothetical protein PUJ72_03165 [Eubacteriales bacterium]|nr:hypothetical protein [Eubacteriales bacterium]